MQMTGRPRPGGAEVLEQRRAEGAGRSVGGFASRATVSLATLSQSRKNPLACGSRKMNLAMLGGLTGPAQTGENSAYPRSLAVRMSRRPLSTNAGVPLIESRTRCTVDRTRCGAGRRRGGRVVAAVRIQDNIPWNRN